MMLSLMLLVRLRRPDAVEVGLQSRLDVRSSLTPLDPREGLLLIQRVGAARAFAVFRLGR